MTARLETDDAAVDVEYREALLDEHDETIDGDRSELVALVSARVLLGKALSLLLRRLTTSSAPCNSPARNASENVSTTKGGGPLGRW